MPRKQGMIARYVLNVEVMMTQPRFPLNGKPEPELRESIHGFSAQRLPNPSLGTAAHAPGASKPFQPQGGGLIN